MEINQETLDKAQAIAKACTKAFNAIYEAFKQFISWITENWKWIKEKVMELHQLEEKRTTKNQLHKINFTRKKISHQVIDRRPKQFIRKIIH